jgi:hypothetical protein
MDAGRAVGAGRPVATRVAIRDRMGSSLPFLSAPPIDVLAGRRAGARGAVGMTAAVEGVRRFATYARGSHLPPIRATGTAIWIARTPITDGRRAERDAPGAGEGNELTVAGDAGTADVVLAAGASATAPRPFVCARTAGVDSAPSTPRGLASTNNGIGAANSTGIAGSTTVLGARGGSMTATAALALRTGTLGDAPLHAHPSRGARSMRAHSCDNRCWARSIM